MRLSTKTRYGCRALAEVAAAYPEGAPSVREIARRERDIFTRLSKLKL